MDDDEIYKDVIEINSKNLIHDFDFHIPELKPMTEEQKMALAQETAKVAEILDRIRTSPIVLRNELCLQLIPYILYRPMSVLQIPPSIFSYFEDLLKQRRNEIDILKAFYQIMNYCGYRQDYYNVIGYFVHCSLWNTLSDILTDAIRAEDSLIINCILIFIALSIDRCDPNQTSPLQNRILDTSLLRQIKIISDNDIHLECESYILSFIKYFFGLPLGERQIEVRDLFYPIVYKDMFREDQNPDIVLLSYQIFEIANETGDLYDFCNTHQEILHKTCDEIASNNPDIAHAALSFLKSLVVNGEEMLDLLERYFDLNSLMECVESENDEISKMALNIVFGIFLVDGADDCKSALINLIVSLDFNETFGKKPLQVKSSLLGHLPNMITYATDEQIDALVNESFTQFLADTMDSDSIHDARIVARILQTAIERCSNSVTVLNSISNVFIESNTFDTMESLILDIDPEIKDAEQISHEINTFLDNFRVLDEDEK